MSEPTAAEAAELEARRVAKRAAMPSVAAIVDEFRDVFGPGVYALGGIDFVTKLQSGWNPPPSPNCDACTGHDDGEGNGSCSRMDRVAYSHDKPEPSKVFCGYRLAMASPINKPEESKERKWRR
jgi:hypothetical protein